MEAITGTLTSIIYSREGFLIGQLASGEPVKGPMSEPVIGQAYKLTGDWVTDPKYGRQFKFNLFQAQLPRSTTGIFLYLTKTAKWVGPVIGQSIVNAYGEEALEILKHDPARVAACIRGLTQKRAEEISKALIDNEGQEAAMVELEDMLGAQRLPKGTIPHLIAKYHSDAPARVRQNPFMLIEVKGIGFPTADRVALGPTLKFVRDGIERRMAGSLYSLEDAASGQGHTWLPGEKFVERVVSLIDLPPGKDACESLLKEGKIVIEQGPMENMIALADLAKDEKDLAAMMLELLSKNEDLTDSLTVPLKGLATDQVDAFRLCLAHSVFILTGAPGTGKTYTLRRIIEQFKAWNYRIALAAPTGKAAKRMNEMIGMPASTIHKLLGPEPRFDAPGYQGETKFFFHYGINAALPVDALVIDEFSMVDVSLAASLFRAVAAGTRVLIVGDHYQLPSVGPGAVLRDLLAAGVPSHELTEIKRNTGDIVQACHAIKDDRPVHPSPTLDLETGMNLRHIEVSDPVHIQGIIRDLVVGRLPKRGYNAVWDVQVLSPMNERTDLSCAALNELLQAALNINPAIKGTPFRVGDKVLQKKNESLKDGTFVVNGDLGEVEEVTKSEIIVTFRDPERLVRIKRGDHHLALAYCMTIHKMQGSEAPVIIMPLHSSFGGFVNRELVYTGLSRAQEICITVGEWGALEAAAKRVGNVKRITRLTEFLAPIKAIKNEFPEFGGPPPDDDIPF